MKVLLKALVLALLLPALLEAQTPSLNGAHLYSPATNLEQSELEMLRSARKSVDIAMYSFTDRELAQELVDLAHFGVKIRVYRDRTEYHQEMERSDLNTTAILIAAGIEVRVQRSEGSYAFESIPSRRLRTNRVRELVADGAQAPG